MESYTIRCAQRADRPEWIRMRSALWPEQSKEKHGQEIEPFFADHPTHWAERFLAVAAFVSVRPGGGLSGFVEVSLRLYADDCETSPVAYIEGWFVDLNVRRKDIGRALIAAAERWALDQGSTEIASDCEIANTASQDAHSSLGFEESSRIVRLRKRLT